MLTSQTKRNKNASWQERQQELRQGFKMLTGYNINTLGFFISLLIWSAHASLQLHSNILSDSNLQQSHERAYENHEERKNHLRSSIKSKQSVTKVEEHLNGRSLEEIKPMETQLEHNDNGSKAPEMVKHDANVSHHDVGHAPTTTGNQVQEEPKTLTNELRQETNGPRKPRVLLGVFTYDYYAQIPYRRKFRNLFDVFPNNHDYRVCSLGNFEKAVRLNRDRELGNKRASTGSSCNATVPKNHNDENFCDDFYEKTYNDCQFIYTFVIAANKSNDAPTVIGAPVEGSHSLLYPRSNETLQNHSTADIQESGYQSKWTDFTLLNIRENMNDGKSQTWFHYGALVSEELGIDYVGKWDADTLPYLDMLFDWMNVQHRLPPSPYNTNILIGNPVDKHWWWQKKDREFRLTKDQHRREDFFDKQYSNIFHVYVQGQCYIMSIDLAKFVAQETQRVMEDGQYDRLRKRQVHEAEEKRKVEDDESSTQEGNSTTTDELEFHEDGDYIEGHEDHDVAAMAFHSPNPIQFQMITRYQRFWRHGLKNKGRYGRNFEGHNFWKQWEVETERMQDWVLMKTDHASPEIPKGDELKLELQDLRK